VTEATIITGASSGLGRALAVSLAAHGHGLLLVGRDRVQLAQTQAACLSAGARAESCSILVKDVNEPDAAQLVVSAAVRAYGGIAALVNNAAIATAGELASTRPTDWLGMLQTNVISPAALIKEATPALRSSCGAIVNVGSIGGVLALPGRSMYGASKAALAHMTRSLARELAPDIRVNAVIPGAIDTGMYEKLGLEDAAVAQLRAEMVRTTPLGRMGRVEDVVPWIEMLLGPAGRWMTGSLLVIDGGRSC
jgi:NAD(P)-dependent dehydrogenase (short-subunit alcohol dehydrogenase family)